MQDPKPYLSEAALEANMGYWQEVYADALQTVREALLAQSKIYYERQNHEFYRSPTPSPDRH